MNSQDIEKAIKEIAEREGNVPTCIVSYKEYMSMIDGKPCPRCGMFCFETPKDAQ